MLSNLKNASLAIAVAFIAFGFVAPPVVHAAAPDSRLAELDAFWAEVSRAVHVGDFEAYRATCHADGVLVNEKTSVPLASALARWKQGFLDTQAGKLKADVQFRFSTRRGDATTAHETGIFCYSTIDATGQRKEDYIHFESCLVKRGTWKTLMEFQKRPATKEEWDALK